MDIKKLNPGFYERFENFALKEVPDDPEVKIPDRERNLAILATLIGCGGVDVFSEKLEDALLVLSPEEIQEVVYQSVDYVGYGRMYPFLEMMDEVFESRNVTLPLPSGTQTTLEDRFQKGLDAQVEIFGEQMRENAKKSTVNKWLAANCFGDFYTRKYLSLKDRELITFCYLLAQGGCEPQMKGHLQGNINMGNNPAFLKKVVLNVLPYIGYPRTLNALSVIEAAK